MLNPLRMKLLSVLDKRQWCDALYAYAPQGPAWDIGGPQPELVRLAESGEIKGDILDIGCGTGDNSIYFARLGHEVWGIDSSSLAVEKATSKARQLGVDVRFMVGDALNLTLGRTFDTVIDCALFHLLTNKQRKFLSQNVFSVLRAGGTYIQLSMSDREPKGPRVYREEILAAFQDGWRVNYIREATKQTRDRPEAAWLSSITRV